MTAAQSLRSAEQRAMLILHSRHALLALGTVLVLGAAYGLGVRQGRVSEQLENVNHALQNSAHALQAASLHRDSTKVVAERAVQHSDSQRVVTRTARGKFAVVDDSTIAINVRSVPASTESVGHGSTGSVSMDSTRADSLHSLDSLQSLQVLHVPPPVIAYIRQADAQIHDDSVTIAAQQADIGALEVKDSLHVEREHLLETKVDVVGKEQFWRGAKIGAAAVVVARGVVWLVFHH